MVSTLTTALAGLERCQLMIDEIRRVLIVADVIKVKAGFWRMELFARAQRLARDAEILPEDAQAGANKHLKRAEQLTEDRQSIFELWSGSQVEMAWTEIRLAEEALIQAATQRDVIVANGHKALAQAKRYIAGSDSRITGLATSMAEASKPPSEAQLKQIKSLSVTVAVASHEVSDAEHRSQRQFRNMLRQVTLTLGVLLAVLVVGSLILTVPKGWVPVPTGFTTPGHAVVGAILFGAFGALFSAVPSLTQAPVNSTTFNPTVEQAVLKIVVGGWSALVGLIAVSAGIEPAATGSASLAGFAIMCAVFGSMQEAITRFADQKADSTKPPTA